MDDNTALWLLSALLQSMATLWGIFFLFFFFFVKREETTKRFEKNNLILLLIWNAGIFFAISLDILAFIFFRNEIILNGAIVATAIGLGSVWYITSVFLYYGIRKN